MPKPVGDSSKKQAIKTLFPEPATTSSRAMHTKLTNQWKAQVELVELAMQHPHHAQDIRDTFKSLVDDAAKTKAQGEDRFASATFVSDVDIDWWKAWFVRRGAARTAMDRVETHDKHGIRRSVVFVLKSSWSFSIGDVCQDQAVLDKTATMRSCNIDTDRVKTYIDRILQPDGRLDWTQAVYAVVWDGGLAVKLCHLPTGDEADIRRWGIDSTWQIDHNESDQNAELVHEPTETRRPIAKAFPRKTGPHKVPVLKGSCEQWHRFAMEAKAELDNLKANANVSFGSYDKSRPAKRVLTPEQKEAAVKLLKERKEASARSRLIAVSNDAPSACAC